LKAARTDAGWPDWSEPENIRSPLIAVNGTRALK
jgi:hypothetical protein